MRILILDDVLESNYKDVFASMDYYLQIHNVRKEDACILIPCNRLIRRRLECHCKNSGYAVITFPIMSYTRSNNDVLNYLTGDPNYRILSITDGNKRKHIDRLKELVIEKKLSMEHMTIF